MPFDDNRALGVVAVESVNGYDLQPGRVSRVTPGEIDFFFSVVG